MPETVGSCLGSLGVVSAVAVDAPLVVTAVATSVTLGSWIDRPFAWKCKQLPDQTDFEPKTLASTSPVVLKRKGTAYGNRSQYRSAGRTTDRDAGCQEAD